MNSDDPMTLATARIRPLFNAHPLNDANLRAGKPDADQAELRKIKVIQGDQGAGKSAALPGDRAPRPGRIKESQRRKRKPI